MQPLRSSFDRARQADFAAHFYDIFLHADPYARNRFARTDFSRQRDLLVHAVYSMLDLAEGRALGKLALDRLARLHAPDQLDVPPQHYLVWMSCFLKALRSTDPEIDDDLEQKWREVLEKSVRVMTETYRAAAKAQRA